VLLRAVPRLSRARAWASATFRRQSSTSPPQQQSDWSSKLPLLRLPRHPRLLDGIDTAWSDPSIDLALHLPPRHSAFLIRLSHAQCRCRNSGPSLCATCAGPRTRSLLSSSRSSSARLALLLSFPSLRFAGTLATLTRSRSHSHIQVSPYSIAPFAAFFRHEFMPNVNLRLMKTNC
jgi:hypothetical protein